MERRCLEYNGGRGPEAEREQAFEQEEKMESVRLNPGSYQVHYLQAASASRGKVLPVVCIQKGCLCNVWQAGIRHEHVQTISSLKLWQAGVRREHVQTVSSLKLKRASNKQVLLACQM